MNLRLLFLAVLVSDVTKCVTGQNRNVCYGMSECMVTASCVARHRDANSDALRTRPVYTCGHHGDDTVCCPVVDAAERDNHRNRMLLPEDSCARAPSNSKKIVFGENATVGELPWIALIGVKGRNNTGILYHCGGSVINSRYVLTAAHCVGPNFKVDHVRLAEHDLRQNPDLDDRYDEPVHVTDIRVSRIHSHENYSSTTLRNDIALLRLKTHIVFSDYINTICLPFGKTDMAAEGKKYTVAGWGMTGSGTTARRSEVLQKAIVEKMSGEDCQTVCTQRSISNITIDATKQLCASSSNRGNTCMGDSGGPLVTSDGFNYKLVLVGLVSFGFGDCDAQFGVTVYTRVHPYLDWILETITS